VTQQFVVPEPDAFGFRLGRNTPLAHVVAVLRRHNPTADLGQLKRAAEQLRAGGRPQVSREPRPDRFDSGTGADGPAAGNPSAPVVADADPAADMPNPARAEVAAWVARQKGLAKGLTMNKSGRIPAAVLSAYREAHRDEYLATLVPVEGGAPMPADPPPVEVD